MMNNETKRYRLKLSEYQTEIGADEVESAKEYFNAIGLSFTLEEIAEPELESER